MRLTPALLATVTAVTLILTRAPAMAGPPDEPRVVEDMAEIGKPGGELRMLITRERETRFFNIYGYAHLIGFNKQLELVPDILAGFDVQDGRVFTLHLRKGHKWSDGEPFTAEDFRFYWEDVALNKELSPTGPDIQLVVDGELPKVEILDERTVRYSWSKPNPLFLPALAAANQLFIYRPAHYLKRFHARYADPEALKKLVAETRSRDWAQLFLRKDRLNDFDDPDNPTLQPWMLTTHPPAQRFVAVRNPYFHRVDKTGRQLPYIDRFILDLVDGKLIPIKTGAGETDLQARRLVFKDYTFLKESEQRSGLVTLLWPEARSAHLALYPNLNATDPVWRSLFRDLRFRKALALALDRDALSQFMYAGLAEPSNNTILPESPLWRDEYGAECASYDPETANRLLDELGLAKRNPQGTRLLPDGRPMELVVELSGEDNEQTDVLEIVRDQWREIGFKIMAKPSDRQIMRSRVYAGSALMSMFFGIDNGVPTAILPPKDFAPTSQGDQLQWPKWGQHFETQGTAGEPPDLPEAKRLLELYREWATATADRQAEIWHEMLGIYASQCYTIGLVAKVQQPVAARASLRNLPEQAIFNWEPHGQFGIYGLDTFFYAR
ncbi:ABC transporter substrate-binding protein [Benzoatithermus flavus]|uniref:ABC transporter substrate-binding protein n=1 Tax=Benzoatithermus flavus TaxID=3108223 RepID=A0ABU8XTX8_9PROT